MKTMKIMFLEANTRRYSCSLPLLLSNGLGFLREKQALAKPYRQLKQTAMKQMQFIPFIPFISFILFISSPPARAQVSATVSLNRKSVYIEQPFHVTVTVYTHTWFTQPVEFGNLQIPNAFIVPFDSSQPGMFTIGGKQYPGVQFYYIVFPYKVGNYTVPSLEITAQSPPLGSSESRKVVIHTQAQTFSVKDIPAEMKKAGDWFVAKNVSIHETWDPSSETYKVGDVVKRTLRIDAAGTLPQFIPALDGKEKLDWASSYPREAVLTDSKSGGDVNGRSVQTIAYLLEKEGDYTIPSIVFSYWNPYTFKQVKASTVARKIHVEPNPNLGILATLKDSLQASVPLPPGSSGKKAPQLILGMHWYTFTVCAIGALILLRILFYILKHLYKKICLKRKAYLNSEKYLFRRMMRASGEPRRFMKALYRWWDSIAGKPSASIGATLDIMGKEDESKIVKTYFDKVVQNENEAGAGVVKQTLKKLRKEKQSTDAGESSDPFISINQLKKYSNEKK